MVIPPTVLPSETMEFVHDERFLIRVFVRLRAEKQSAPQRAIYASVLQQSKYKLPLQLIAPDCAEILRKSFAELQVAHIEAKAEESCRNDGTCTYVKVLAPYRIVYSDSFSGCAISYEEYEGRYFAYLARSKASIECARVKEDSKKRYLSPKSSFTLSAPVRRLSEDFSLAKRPRL